MDDSEARINETQLQLAYNQLERCKDVLDVFNCWTMWECLQNRKGWQKAVKDKKMQLN